MTQSQTGRSMIEMLGVLAIIGVLSVGGITGYSMAMRMKNANDLMDGASKFFIALSSVYQSGSNFAYQYTYPTDVGLHRIILMCRLRKQSISYQNSPKRIFARTNTYPYRV